MSQHTTTLEIIRVAIPIILVLIFWVYLGFITRDIKNMQSHLKDRLWLDEPSQSEQSQLDRDLKKYISVKEIQANRTKIFAILFTGLAIIFIFITNR